MSMQQIMSLKNFRFGKSQPKRVIPLLTGKQEIIYFIVCQMSFRI